jgi:hypothetical protein
VKRIIFLLLALTCPVVHCQTFSASFTVTDSDSQAWNNAGCWAQLIDAGGPPVYGGNPVPTTPISCNLSNAGLLSTSSLYNTSTITPAGAVYKFTICPTASVPCQIFSLAATSSIQLSAAVNANITAPRFPAGGGAFGYADVEVYPTLSVGQPYYNVVSSQTRYWCGSSFSTSCAGVASITGGTIDGTVIGGTTPAAGNFTSVTATGNVSVQGTISSTNNTLPASITNSGVALTAAPNVADEVYYNAPYTTNNHIAEHIWFQNCLQSRFKSDDQSSAVTPLSLCGGYGTGITGISSNSGSGSWAHTGSFSATGTIKSAGSFACTANGTNCPYVPIFGTTGSIGGALLAVGSCSTGTATIAGGTAGHTVSVSASDGSDPGGSFFYRAVTTNSTTVTVSICAAVLGTPASKTYNVSTY